MARTAVVAGTATAVSNRVSRRQARRWSQDSGGYDQSPPQGQGYEQYPPQQAPPPTSYAAPAPAAPAPGGGDDLTSNLQQLITLREQGMLTEAEFSAAKAKLLGT
jgi:hypothetical protein